MPVRRWDGCLPHRGSSGSGTFPLSPSGRACSSSSIGSDGTLAETGYRRLRQRSSQPASRGVDGVKRGRAWDVGACGRGADLAGGDRGREKNSAAGVTKLS